MTGVSREEFNEYREEMRGRLTALRSLIYTVAFGPKATIDEFIAVWPALIDQARKENGSAGEIYEMQDFLKYLRAVRQQQSDDQSERPAT